MTKVDRALALAARGFYVFPLAPGAKEPPLIFDFPAEASASEAVVRAWWARWPDANIGISTSHYRGAHLLVVDVDTKGGKDGNLALLGLELEGFVLPPTFTQHTPTGGRHLAYVVDKSIRQGANVLGPGVDTRGFHGYIVGAGSEIGGIEYSIADDCDVHVAPEWLVERCGRARVRADKQSAGEAVQTTPDSANSRAVHFLRTDAALAVEGAGGDETTFKVACRLKDFGVDMPTACQLMAEHWNPRCSPPWQEIGLSHKVRNAYAYGVEPAGVAAPESVFTVVPPTVLPDQTLAAVHPVLELNKVHAFVLAGGGAHILWETTDANGKYSLEHLAVSAFHQKHAAWKLRAGKRTEPVTSLWMEDPQRRSYDGLCFRPQQPAPPRFYNLWRGFAYEPAAPGEIFPDDQHDALESFLDHARNNVCQGDGGLFRWLIGYFGHLVQRPWEKPLVALVFRGGKGVGKNAVVERVGALLGGHFLVTSNRRYLVGNFNGHLENCLLFALDEAFWSGDKQAEGQLKDLITGKEHVVEHKGKEPFRVDNRTRVVIIGNEQWLVPATEDERRFAVFDVGDGRKQDLKFFERMRTGMERGGYRLLLRYLLDYDLSGIDINQAPATAGLLDQKHNSLEPVKQWWLDCLNEGRVVGGAFGGDWPELVECDQLREAFKRAAAERRITARLPDATMMGKVFRDICQDLVRTKKRTGGATAWVYKVPSLEACRAAWDRYIGQPVVWSAE